MVYKWKYNQNVPAQKAGEYFEQLESDYGEVNARLLIKESQSKDALFHSCFEWNNDRAADKYRTIQAGNIIRALVIEEDVSESETVQVRAFVSLKDDTEQYHSIAKIMSDKDKRDRLLKNAKDELLLFRKKYDGVRELSNIFAEIDRL